MMHCCLIARKQYEISPTIITDGKGGMVVSSNLNFVLTHLHNDEGSLDFTRKVYIMLADRDFVFIL